MCRARSISGAAGPYHDGVVDWDAGCPVVAEVTASSAELIGSQNYPNTISHAIFTLYTW
jgi:hypothetical protein